MDSNGKDIKVVMLPWLAHGHVSPFLELSKRLSQRNFCIYFCSTPIILKSINKKINEKQSHSIQLVEFHLPSLPNLPPHNHTTNGLPSHLMPVLKDALDLASPQFAQILDELKPDLVIFDHNQYWAPTMAKSRNIRAIEFFTQSPSLVCFCLHMMKDPTIPFPYPEMIPRNYKQVVSRVHDEPSSEASRKDFYRITETFKESELILVKSLREFDGEVLDMFSKLVEKKVVTVGPLIEGSINDENESSEIIEWLDKKAKASTVFVSFGTECFLTKEELGEVANGLELSTVNFVWLIRFSAGANITVNEALPKGFLERVGERGKIVEGWAPQIKILKHSSIGAFVSHCGWGSIMESIQLRIPIIPVPMHLDQPFNARLIENIGVGLEVGRAEDGGLKAVEIAKSIRNVLLGKDGDDIRKKVKQFGDIICLKNETEIDGVAKELVRLCREKK